MTDVLPWRVLDGGVALRVRLTPKAAHDRVDGVELTAVGPALKARVRAVPEDGKANAALEVVIAEWLDVPRRMVEVTSGSKSRIKTLHIAGDGQALALTAERALAALAAKTSPGTQS